MDITAIRSEVLSKIIGEFPEKRVFVGRRDEGDDFDLVLTIRVATGVASDAAQEELDKLLNPDGGLKQMLNSVPEWESFGDLTFVRNSGTVLFPTTDGPPLCGSEWTVKVMV